jgi:hypothetical protein
MAKKSGGKKKTGAKKKDAKKSGGKKGGDKKKDSKLAPKAIKTGKGAAVAEVARGVVDMINTRTGDDAIWDQWFGKGFTSIEGVGVALGWSGRKAVKAKGEAWMAEHTVHSMRAEGPYIGATGFAVKFTMDVEVKASGERMTMNEVGVYTVKNGKVVQEEFMYGG